MFETAKFYEKDHKINVMKMYINKSLYLLQGLNSDKKNIKLNSGYLPVSEVIINLMKASPIIQDTSESDY